MNTLDVHGNYFLFDFYCPAESAIHRALVVFVVVVFVPTGSGSNCRVKLLKLTLSGSAKKKKKHGAESATQLLDMKKRTCTDRL